MDQRSKLQLKSLLDKKESKVVDVIDPSFTKQSEFIRDQAKLKALFCTRRASKSYTGGLGLVQAAHDLDNCNVLFIGLTRGSAKGIVWKDILKDINKKHDLGMNFNETELTATCRNGSIVYATGVDVADDEMDKLLGRKYKRVVIDEAASYTIDLRKLVYGVLKPTVIDQGGDIWLMGTSGNLTRGLFFDITNGKEPGWKLFEWTAMDNPYIAKQWQEELEDIRLNRPLFMETPLFKQWYLNQWVIDTDKLVYKYNPERNRFTSLPQYGRGAWSYVLGVDLGYDDASAFVVCAYHEFDKTLFVLESFSQSKMDVTDVANRIKQYQARFDIFKVVVDGANKQAVKEMQNRHGLNLSPADKTGKSDFIEIMNAEFIQGRIKLFEPQNEKYIAELRSLIWDEKKLESTGKREEHPNCDNHLCDAALYSWRYCYQFLSEREKPKVDYKNKSEWLKHTEMLMDRALEDSIKRDEARKNATDMWNLQEAQSENDVLSYYLNKKRNS